MNFNIKNCVRTAAIIHAEGTFTYMKQSEILQKLNGLLSAVGNGDVKEVIEKMQATIRLPGRCNASVTMFRRALYEKF